LLVVCNVERTLNDHIAKPLYLALWQIELSCANIINQFLSLIAMLLLRKRVYEYIKQHSTKLDRFAIITRATDSQLTSTASQTRRAVWSVKSELEFPSV